MIEFSPVLTLCIQILHAGALEVLLAVGFSAEANNGGSEGDCLVLKRDDPVLLWLAESSLEACVA